MQDADERSDQHVEKALEVYVPLAYGRRCPIGVVEVYLPYEPVSRAITDASRRMYLALGVTLVVFYVLMFRMVTRALARLRDSAPQRLPRSSRHAENLPNRPLLLDRLERAVANARRHGIDVGVPLIDLDRFKKINDTLGHETGDMLLHQVGERIGEELRGVDTVARLGGDEFVVLLPDIENTHAAVQVAQRLLDALHRPLTVRGVGLAVEASIGIACYPQHGEGQGIPLQHADVAMYVAKHPAAPMPPTTPIPTSPASRGSRCSTTWTCPGGSGWCSTTSRRRSSATAPCAASRLCCVAPSHPRHGRAERLRARRRADGPDLGAHRACAARGAEAGTGLAERGPRHLRLGDLSARNLMDAQLPLLVEALLRQEGVEPRRLEVEVTETSAMVDPARATGVLRNLSRLGVAAAVDDYGAGYSWLSYLRSLPIGTLRIDRSFVTRMLQG